MKKIINKNKTNKPPAGIGKKILEGAVVGAMFGVAAGMLLASESGKKARKNIGKASGYFYRYMAPQVKKMKLAGKEQYDAFVSKSADNYAKAKKLSLEDKKILIKEGKRFWKHIAKHSR